MREMLIRGVVMRRLAGALATLCVCFPAHAAPLRLSLPECLTRALQGHPDLAESEWDVRLAESRVAEADAGKYPIANVTNISGVAPEARGRVDEPPVDTVDSTGDVGPFTRVEVEIVQPVYTWGKIAAGRRAASKGLEQELARRKQRRDEVIAEVKQEYSELLLARQIVDLLGEVKSNFEKAIDLAQERLDQGAGTVTQSDVLKLKIGLAGIAKEVSKAQNGAELAREALARSMGLPPGEDFDVADAVLDPVSAKLLELERYNELVFKQSPEWQQLLAGLAAREAQVEVEESDYYPSLFVAGGFKYGYAPHRDRQLSPFAKDDFNFLDRPGASVGLRWPLSFLQTRAKVQAAKAELGKLRAQKQTAATGIRLAVKKAYLDVAQSREAVDIAAGGRKAARGLLVTSLSSFELGVGEAKDVFEALIVYTRSASDYYETVNDYNVALARLAQTVGEEVSDLTY